MKKILIIEDEKAINNALKEKLTHEKFDVVQTFDGAEGLSMAVKDTFDVILLDLVMPVKNGFEFIDEYLAKVESPSPIIVLTNLPDFGSEAKATKKGVVSYIVKTNVSLEEIVAKIKSVL